MASLDRIQVAGYKSIREMDLELTKLNVLLGANGSGKSNFISLFGLLNDVVEQRLQVHVAQAGGADALLHFGQKHTPELSIGLQFGRNGYRARFAASADGGLYFVREECSGQGIRFLQPYNVLLGTGHRESGLADEVKGGGSIAKYVDQSMKSWKVYHFHDTSSSAPIKKACKLNDNDSLRPDAANLAAFLYRLEEKHPRAYGRIVDAVQMVASFFKTFRLRPDRLNEEMIRLEWTHHGSDDYFDANALSDGTLRFIALATLLLQPNPPTSIVIDEPELGLHPYAINVLAGLLGSVSEQGQIIVSTQSVTLVDQMGPEDIVVVDRVEHASVFRRPTEAEVRTWMDGYSLGELWEKNVIGGRPKAP